MKLYIMKKIKSLKCVFCVFCIFMFFLSDPQGELWIQSCSQRQKNPEQTALRHEQGTAPSPQHHHAAEERAQHQAAGAILLQTD